MFQGQDLNKAILLKQDNPDVYGTINTCTLARELAKGRGFPKKKQPVQVSQDIFDELGEEATAILKVFKTASKDWKRAEVLATGISAPDWTKGIRELRDKEIVIQKGKKRGASYRIG